MKLCVSHYNHKRIPDAKFESGSFSIFFLRYDVTKFPSEEGNQSSNSDTYSRKMGLSKIKRVFYVQNRSSGPKIDPLVIFSNFQAEENQFFRFQIFETC